MMLMKRTMVWMAVAAMLLVFANAFGAERAHAAGTGYYVDSVNGNDGNSGTSTGSPWKSLAKVNATTFAPGDKIMFKAGGAWTGQLWPKGSGTAGNPIVIDRYGTGTAPRIDGGGSSFTQTVHNSTTTYNSGAVFLKNQEYWEINNLEVTNDDNLGAENNNSAALRAGVVFAIDANASDRVYSHIYIRNLYVHDVDGANSPGAKANGGIIGIIVGTYAKTQRTYARYDDIRIEHNTIDKVDRSGIRVADHNVYLNDDSFSTTSARTYGNWDTNVYVAHNDLTNVGGDGIVVRCTDNAIVEYNVVRQFGTRVTSAIAGIWTTVAKNNIFQYNEVYDGPASNQDGMAYDLDLYLSNTTFQYNYSHDNRQGFLLLMGSNTNDIVRYNISENDGFFIKWVSAAESTPAYIYNNVYYYDGAVAKMTNGSIPANAKLNFNNNVFYNRNANAATDWGPANWAASSAFSHNAFYESGGNHPAGEPSDSHKITANPQLANPGSGGTGLNSLTGYRLQSASPLIGQGAWMNNNGGLDFWGNPLYTGSPDIGAHETTVQDPPASGTVFHPTADAYVRNGSYAGTNYGSDTGMQVKSDASGYARKSYVKFDYAALGGSGSGAASAKLRLFVDTVNTDASRTISVYGTAKTWSETGLTWNNAPAGSTFIGSINASSTAGVWYELDVTGYVNSNMSDKQAAFLLVNEGASSSKGDVQFSTREAAAHAPELVISPAAAAFTIHPVADAYVRDGSYASTNFGADSVLFVKSDAAGYARKSYLKYDYASFGGSSASSAKLRLYAGAVNTAPSRTISVYGTTKTWSETGLTWNNAPAGATLIGSFNAGNTAGAWYEVDVTGYVNSNMSDKQVSFLLVNEGAFSSTGDVQFNSREASVQPPELVIE